MSVRGELGEGSESEGEVGLGGIVVGKNKLSLVLFFVVVARLLNGAAGVASHGRGSSVHCTGVWIAPSLLVEYTVVCEMGKSEKQNNVL